MSMDRRSFSQGNDSPRMDIGLLLLRVSFGVTLFLKHGLTKLVHFHQMSGSFPNPLHLGVLPSLVIATLSDSICSILVVLGLGTRWASLVIFLNIFVAWAMIHHFDFLGQTASSGEFIVLFLGGFLGLILMGGGRYSIDAILNKK